MGNIVKLLRSPFRRKYKDLSSRVKTLEFVVDCLINRPTWIDSERVGFNGQKHRKQIFQDLLNAFNFDAILETGTWIGETTGYMANTSNLPVQTCELNDRLSSLAKMRLQDHPNITFSVNDSRGFLKDIAKTDVVSKRVFFYLDAHGDKDLPLKGELEIICSSWKEFVIMIDDFQVPGDDGYGYDSYEKDNSLSLKVFSRVFSDNGLVPYFPFLSSSDETGAKRGSVILARDGKFCETLDRIQSLRRINTSP